VGQVEIGTGVSPVNHAQDARATKLWPNIIAIDSRQAERHTPRSFDYGNLWGGHESGAAPTKELLQPRNF
jgi:hypothetical protein